MSFAAVAHVVACGGGPAPATPTSEAKPTAAASTASSEAPAPREPVKEEPAAAPKALEAKPPTVKVIEPGAAPRRALRYKFKAGVTEYAEMDLKMSMSMTLGPKEMPHVELPTMRATLRLDAKEVTADGDLKVNSEVLRVDIIKDAHTDAKLIAAFDKEVGGLVGTKGRSTVSPRGVTHDDELEVPATANPKLAGQIEGMREALKDVYVPFPEEEVGKGAKWEVSSRVAFNGVMVDIVATYNLVGLTADSAQTNFDIALSALPNQRLDTPAMANVSATLDSLTGKTTGQNGAPFSKLVGTANSKATMQMLSTASLKGEKVATKVSTEMIIAVRPTKAPAKKK